MSELGAAVAEMMAAEPEWLTYMRRYRAGFASRRWVYDRMATLSAERTEDALRALLGLPPRGQGATAKA